MLLRSLFKTIKRTIGKTIFYPIEMIQIKKINKNITKRQQINQSELSLFGIISRVKMGEEQKGWLIAFISKHEPTFPITYANHKMIRSLSSDGKYRRSEDTSQLQERITKLGNCYVGHTYHAVFIDRGVQSGRKATACRFEPNLFFRDLAIAKKDSFWIDIF